VQDVEIRTLPEGSVRLRGWALHYWGRINVYKKPAVDIELDCTAADAQRLRQRIQDYMNAASK
jgi:hypothetical protein